MNRETSLKPVLCIDLKKNRIRIHKLTLHMLGDPASVKTGTKKILFFSVHILSNPY